MAKRIVYLHEKERNALNEIAQRKMQAPPTQVNLITHQEYVYQGMIAGQGGFQQLGHAEQQAVENDQ